MLGPRSTVESPFGSRSRVPESRSGLIFESHVGVGFRIKSRSRVEINFSSQLSDLGWGLELILRSRPVSKVSSWIWGLQLGSQASATSWLPCQVGSGSRVWCY